MDWLLAVAFPQWDTVIKSKSLSACGLGGPFYIPKASRWIGSLQSPFPNEIPLSNPKAFRPAALTGLFISPRLQDGLAPCSRLSPMRYRYQIQKSLSACGLDGPFYIPKASRWIGSRWSPFPNEIPLSNPKKPFGLRP